MHRFRGLVLVLAHVGYGPLATWEGPTELLLAKVKNASGRIGIFDLRIGRLAPIIPRDSAAESLRNN